MSRIVSGLWVFGLIFPTLAIASIFFYFELKKLGFLGIMKNKFIVIILLMSAMLILHLYFASSGMLCGTNLNSFPIAPQTRASFAAAILISTIFSLGFYSLHYLLIYLRSNGTALLPHFMEVPVKTGIIVMVISGVILSTASLFDLVLYYNSDQICVQSPVALDIQLFGSAVFGLSAVFLDVTFVRYFVAYVWETRKRFGRGKTTITEIIARDGLKLTAIYTSYLITFLLYSTESNYFLILVESFNVVVISIWIRMKVKIDRIEEESVPSLNLATEMAKAPTTVQKSNYMTINTTSLSNSSGAHSPQMSEV